MPRLSHKRFVADAYRLMLDALGPQHW